MVTTLGAVPMTPILPIEPDLDVREGTPNPRNRVKVILRARWIFGTPGARRGPLSLRERARVTDVR